MKPLIFNLDTRDNSYEIVDLMQGYDYNFEFIITDQEQDLTLEPYSKQIHMMKGDNNFIIQTENITTTGNVLKVAIDKDLTREHGVGKLQIVLVKDDKAFGSWVVKLNIKESAINDSDGKSESKATITETLIKAIDEAKGIDLTEDVAQAKILKTELETQSTTAEGIRRNLSANIIKGEELNTEMDASIIEGNRLKGELKTGVIEANEAKHGVLGAVSDGREFKTELEALIPAGGAYSKSGGLINGNVFIANTKTIFGKNKENKDVVLINVNPTNGVVNVGDVESDLLISSKTRVGIWEDGKKKPLVVKDDFSIQKGINGFVKYPVGDTEFIQQWGEFEIEKLTNALDGESVDMEFSIPFTQRVVSQGAVCSRNLTDGAHDWTANVNCSAVVISHTTIRIEVSLIKSMPTNKRFQIRWNAMGY